MKLIVTRSGGNEIASIVIPVSCITVSIICSRLEVRSQRDGSITGVGQTDNGIRSITPPTILEGNLVNLTSLQRHGVASGSAIEVHRAAVTVGTIEADEES